MINTINIHNLSQENVSCLNTALIILMLANRRSQMPKYLQAIRSKSNEMTILHSASSTSSLVQSTLSSSSRLTSSTLNSSNSSQHSQHHHHHHPTSTSSSYYHNNNHHHPHQHHQFDLICNFKDLLVFWQNHYLQKDKDFTGLEQNSKIGFSYWKSTVEMLLESNCNSPKSLNYYLKNEFNTCNKKPIDEYRPD